MQIVFTTTLTHETRGAAVAIPTSQKKDEYP
jgi:hypothetical protein